MVRKLSIVAFVVCGLVLVLAQVPTYHPGPQLANAVSKVVNSVFSVNWVEASVQPGADIETQIANACSALAAKGAGGGFITVSFTGTRTGALNANPFANCPDNASPGNGTIIFFISSPNGTIITSYPWLTPNKSRLYGAFGWLARGWTTIKAGSNFKTIANKRNAALARNTGLSRSSGGVVTATFTNTDAALGTAITLHEPIAIGCSSTNATDQSFVGTWDVASSSSTTITYNQPQLGSATNSNGACTLVAGTPLIGMAENNKDGTISGGCTPGTNCYGNATAAFGAGVLGLTLDCDDLAGNTGCVGIRNILSQERTYVSDVGINNFNFIGMVLDNMSTTGLQNSGPYTNIELYASPAADSHDSNCNPINAANTSYPLEGIYMWGLSVRSVSAYTMTTSNCTDTSAPFIGLETSNTGNVELGTLGTIHCEGFNVCVEIGQQQASNGGVTVIGMGGAPADTRLSGTAHAIDISANYATTDVSCLNTRRNTGMVSAIVNNIDGDNLNGAGDAVVAMYSWDIQATIGSTVLTTSQTVPNRMVGLTVNRIITTGSLLPSCSSTGIGTALNGAACGFTSNSSDSLGTIQLTTASTGTAASGVVTLTFTSPMGGHVPSCVYTLSNAGATAWVSGASILDNGGSSTTNAKSLWANNGTPLSSSTTYNYNYVCAGKN